MWAGNVSSGHGHLHQHNELGSSGVTGKSGGDEDGPGRAGGGGGDGEDGGGGGHTEAQASEGSCEGGVPVAPCGGHDDPTHVQPRLSCGGARVAQ